MAFSRRPVSALCPHPPAHGLALLCLSAMLSACGGGGASEPVETSPVAVSSPAPSPLETSASDAVALNVNEAGGNDQDDPPAQEVTAPAPTPAPEPAPAPAPAPVASPAFLTRFEGIEYVDGDGSAQHEQLSGIVAPVADVGVQGAGSFDLDPGSLTIQYEGGDVTERWARIVTEPNTANDNRVLQFLLAAPNVRDDAGQASKGRVQLNAYNIERVRAKELRFTARMYLTSDFDLLCAMGQSFTWLTISEWWNNAGWTSQPYPFRVAVNLTKPNAAAGSALRFSVHAQTLNETLRTWDTTVWSQTNLDVDVPVGRWATLEYHFREGDANNGRFYLALVPDGGVRQVIFDIQNWTHHPADPAPDGITHVNPLKLYTSKALVEHVRNAGGALQVLWDDLGFRLCRERMDAATSPCAPATFN